MAIPNRLDLESQLYGILKTLKTVHKDMMKGKTSYPSYCNIVRQKINDLMVVELTFHAKGLKLDKVLNDMMVSEEFFTLIPQIHEFITINEQKNRQVTRSPSSLTESEKTLNNITSAKNKTAYLGKYAINPIVLANLASQITGNFITIFDFFKMELQDPQLLQDNFQRLENALKEFPGLDELYLDFKSLIRDLSSQNSFTDNRPTILLSFEKLYRRYLAVLKNPSNL